ncbi:protein kinase domain-containing protein [Streptomyces longisporoflavus]|uniref:PQQ-binding-like beta-propeller repeat protein n=1 Tax=Streptomyces longisporoflavus TaxID=28044 RepID=A0ABW7QLG2_9ACTN
MALRDSDPDRIGGYPIDDRLGSGGMGVVYLARSASGRRLAVKVVHGQYADDPEFRTRFRREVDAARQVSGAFTAPVVDADADAPSPWMATLYIPGENLGTHVRREGPLPPARLQELAAGLTEALRDIHRVGVVHRDLKPANVMLADDGPRVIDFGVSRTAGALVGDPLTQTGRVMGTPPYMSPEQLTAPREVGPASDVFSLGAVLVHAATGRGPFDSDSPYETATRVVEGEPELDGVPEELLPIVEQCLAKDPASRPTADALLALLRGEPLPDPPPAATPRAARPRRRRRLIIGAAVGGALLAVLGAGVVVRLATSQEPGDGDLPAGWRAWQAKDTSGAADDASGPFLHCAAVLDGLVCAGNDVKAVRFSLATGKAAWSLPVDAGPDSWSLDEGAVIGRSGHRLFVYRNDQTEESPDAAEPDNDYAIQAIDARTGHELWTRPTQRGANAMAPVTGTEAVTTGVAATVASVKGGVLSVYGKRGDSYALLGAADGRPLWRRPFPRVTRPDGECELHSAAGHGYLLCPADDPEGTRISRLDPATGKPALTASAGHDLSFVGHSGGRLFFTDQAAKTHRRITVLDLRTRRLRTVRLAAPQSGDATVTLSRGTLYFTSTNGTVRAVDPRTGRQAWSRNSSVEMPGPPLASDSHVYLASPSGRLAALDRHTGEIGWTRPGRGPATPMPESVGAPLSLVGDALYVPYGTRSVYSVNVRNP